MEVYFTTKPQVYFVYFVINWNMSLIYIIADLLIILN